MLDRPIPEKTGAVMNILHVAGAQILFMEVPDRAAVDIASLPLVLISGDHTEKRNSW